MKLSDRPLSRFKPARLLGAFFVVCALPISVVATNFSPGSVVVERVSGGAAALTSGAMPVYLDEYLPATANQSAPVQSVSLPSAATRPTSNPFNFMDSGAATSDGQLTRSADGLVLQLAGYNGITGDPSIVNSGGTINRVIGVVKSDASEDTSRILDAFTNGNNFRSVVSLDGSAFWCVGATNDVILNNLSGGIIYYTNGMTPVKLASVDARYIDIFNNQLFYSTQTAPIGIYELGSGLPTDGAPAATLEIPLSTLLSGTPSPVAFQFNSATNICYVADSRGSKGGVFKLTYNGSGWVSNYLFGTSLIPNGAAGLAVNWSGANPVLYVTTQGGTNLIAITDTGAASMATLLAKADGATNVFRGVALAPTLTYTLTYAAAAGGTIYGNTSQTVAYEGSGSTVIAVPNAGDYFISWSDGVVPSSRTDEDVTNNLNVTARFAQALVTTARDSGAGSLRQILANAAPGSTIIFDPSLSGQTITLTGGELLLTNNLSIDASALPGGITIDGNGSSRVFEIAGDATNVLNSLTIANGISPYFGGGIDVDSDGALTLNECTIAWNTVDSTTPGVPGQGGGIYNAGALTVNESTLAENMATGDGSGGGYGGAIYNNGGLVTVNQSTLSGNSTDANGYGGGVCNASGMLTLFNSVVAGNTNGNGGDIDNEGIISVAGVNFTNGVPLLAALGNYGGPTPTMPPLPGSPALDGCTGGTSFTTDQRGLPRIIGPFADIGSVEANPDVTNYLATNNVTFASYVTLTAGVSGTGTLAYQWYENGTAISAATNATLSLSNPVTASATYEVTVSNPYGGVTNFVTVNVTRWFQIAGFNSAGLISWTNAFASGICSVESATRLNGSNGVTAWVPGNNYYTTNPAGAVSFTPASGNAFFRMLAVDISSNNPLAFSNLVNSYGILSTVAGNGDSDYASNDRGEDVTNYWVSSFEVGQATNAALSRPHFAMEDDSSNVFIVDKDSDSVLKVTPDGLIHTVAGTHAIGDGPDTSTIATNVAMNTPNGLWVRGDGTVYVLDTGNGKVRRLDTNGMMMTMFTDGSYTGGGRGLWVKNDESIVYYASGTSLRQWTTNGGGTIKLLNTSFNDLGNIVVSGTNIVATDRGDNSVWLVNTNNGGRTLLFGTPEINGTNLVVDGSLALTNSLYGVRGVWQPPTGGYILATDYGAQLLYVDLSGVIHILVNGYNHDHAGDGQWFYSPITPYFGQLRSVTMDNRGNLIIVENDYGYVRKIDFHRLIP